MPLLLGHKTCVSSKQSGYGDGEGATDNRGISVGMLPPSSRAGDAGKGPGATGNETTPSQSSVSSAQHPQVYVYETVSLDGSGAMGLTHTERRVVLLFFAVTHSATLG